MSEEELLRKNNVLMSHGNLPCDTTTCETYGLSGNCGKDCSNFKSKTCDVYVDVLERINEELQQENEELKEQLEVGKEQYNDLVEEKEKLQEQLSIITLELEEYKSQVHKGLYSTCLPYKNGYNKAIEENKTQQKEFIEWLENEIQKQKDYGASFGLTIDRDIAEYISEKIDVYKKVLSKYKEIIGVDK